MEKPKELFQLRRRVQSGAMVLRFLFWLWAVIGFFVIIIEIASAFNLRASPQGIGIGTSGFISMEILFWVAGLIALGLGSVLAGTEYVLLKSDEIDP